MSVLSDNEPPARSGWPAYPPLAGADQKIFSRTELHEGSDQGGPCRSRSSEGLRTQLFRSPFSGFFEAGACDRVLPKVISEIKNGWLRIEQM